MVCVSCWCVVCPLSVLRLSCHGWWAERLVAKGALVLCLRCIKQYTSRHKHVEGT